MVSCGEEDFCVGSVRQKKFRTKFGMILFKVLVNYLFLDDLDFLLTSFLSETAQTRLITQKRNVQPKNRLSTKIPGKCFFSYAKIDGRKYTIKRIIKNINAKITSIYKSFLKLGGAPQTRTGDLRIMIPSL